ncbi:HAD family hydrolase [Natronoglycomyces albus]|uniref:HAD family hydrolase n=1 Tax=Natronoglycomyces albus TaxID=2811108 RepID=A0A895XMG8_9ACTN|nr:HAD family hydrolase [Natronoglycomyces albus]QSB06861.1 HAD family hydrolase [Natronoglycomyces albus]
MSKSNIAAVLFDLDGTLLDHDTASATAVVTSFRAEPSITLLDEPHLIKRWEQLQETYIRRYFNGEMTFHEQRRARVRAIVQELGLGEWNQDRIDRWCEHYLETYERHWRLYSDVWPTLNQLRGERPQLCLGTVTNGDSAQQRSKLARFDLDMIFRHVTISSEVGAAKPDPAIFRLACENLDLPPDQVMYIGDRPDHDALAAQAAGLRGVWLHRADSRIAVGDYPLPKPRIGTLSDVPSLIRRGGDFPSG